ncbi:hypothetical protein WMY93_031298 [Mugilogobius chulae]|uniref:Uncharacterized protein n=1 Tax=Mugilogobius chulae TaxID=88201 RepID=A0AAW0MDT6_9GOBI
METNVRILRADIYHLLSETGSYLLLQARSTCLHRPEARHLFHAPRAKQTAASAAAGNHCRCKLYKQVFKTPPPRPLTPTAPFTPNTEEPPVTIDLELHIPKAKFRGSVSHYDIYLCRVPRRHTRSPKLNPDGAKQRVLRWDDHRHTSSPRPCSVYSPNSLSDPFSGQLRWARADTPSSCMF